MNPPTTIICADTGGPCEVCGGACWAVADGHRVHSLTCWPLLTEGTDTMAAPAGSNITLEADGTLPVDHVYCCPPHERADCIYCQPKPAGWPRCCNGPIGCTHSNDQWAAIGIDRWKLTKTIDDPSQPVPCSYCDIGHLTIWIDDDGRPVNLMCGTEVT